MFKRAKELLLKSLLLFFVFSIASPAFALDQYRALDQYVGNVWTAEHGLPQNSAYAIAQTDDGYIWIGTGDGLARFNGNSFTVFDNGNTPGMKNNLIWRLFKSRDGTLWIGTQGGLLYYRDEKISPLTAADSLSITDLGEDRQGNLWIAAEGKRLLKKSGGEVHEVRLPGDGEIQSYRRIYFDRSDALWISSSNGLFLYQDGKLTRFSVKDGLSSANIFMVFQDSRLNLWIGTDGGGLNLFRDNHFRQITIKDGLPQNDILTVFEDRQGNIWVGTRGGVCRINGSRIASLTAREGLSANTVMSFCEDREGSLWVGTAFGVNRLRDGNVITLGMRHGLPTEHIWSVYEDSHNVVWIGTQGGGLVRMAGNLLSIVSSRAGLPNNVVRSMLEDNRGRLWIGTYAGLACLENGKVTSFGGRDGVSDEAYRAIFQERSGRIWFGTVNGLFYLESGRFHRYDFSGVAQPLFVFSIFQDRGGAIWIGSRRLIIRIVGDRYQLFNDSNGFSGDQVFSFGQDQGGRIWLATSMGLGLFREGIFTFLTTEDGLPNNVINKILIDASEDFWMSSNRGIIHLRSKDLLDYISGKNDRLHPEVFGLEDGLKTTEGNSGQNAGCIGHDGRIFFVTLKGLAIVIARQKSSNNIVPPVKIEEVVAGARKLKPNLKAILKPGTSGLEFHYAALSYVLPAKVRFKYMLAGLDENWVEAGSRRDAYYTNLPPGDYTFKVIACNNDGVWNRAGASFSFYVRPFFYQTKWFYALSGLALVFMAILLYRWRIRQLKAREKHLTLLVAKRTKELNEALAKVERLSLTDPLTQLPNRRHFEIIFAQEWKSCCREANPLSLLMMDIDLFKVYNDTYGHPLGDECLKKVAAAIQGSIQRASDFAARIGGEEFIIILPNTDPDGALSVAERVRSAIEACQIPQQMSTVSPFVTVSVGVASAVPRHDLDGNSMLALADQALYQAKKQGRNRSHLFAPGEIA